jgi:Tfp pilus assembly protein FimV
MPDATAFAELGARVCLPPASQALEAELASSAAAAQQLQAELLTKDVEGSILRQQLTAAAQQLQQLSEQLSAAQAHSSEEVSQVGWLWLKHGMKHHDGPLFQVQHFAGSCGLVAVTAALCLIHRAMCTAMPTS